jgi:gas vesicle protein
MAENDSNFGFGYLLLGLAAGAAAGILFAPRSGEETRERIAEKAKDGMLYAKDTVDELKQQLQVGLDCTEDAVMQFKGRVEASVADAREKLQEALRAGEIAYQDEISQLQAELDTPPA